MLYTLARSQQYFMTFMTFTIALMFSPTFLAVVDGSSVEQPSIYQNIQARNLSTFLNSVPVQCQVQCDIVVGAAHSCQFLTCVCTNEHALELQDCVNCVVALTPYADGIVDQYQAVLDEWQNSYCAQFPTPPLHVVLPGQSSSSFSTATPSSTSASSTSGSTPSAKTTSSATLNTGYYSRSLVTISFSVVLMVSLSFLSLVS